MQCFSPSIESQALCNYWNETTLKYLGKQHWFGINHNFNLTESDPAPLAVISPLPTHARSLLQGVWGKWDIQPVLPGKSLFKWSAIDLVGILDSKTVFWENEIAPGTSKSIQRFKEAGWIWWHLGGNRYFSFLIIRRRRDYKLNSFQTQDQILLLSSFCTCFSLTYFLGCNTGRESLDVISEITLKSKHLPWYLVGSMHMASDRLRSIKTLMF